MIKRKTDIYLISMYIVMPIVIVISALMIFLGVAYIINGQLDNPLSAVAFICIPLLFLFVVPYSILNARRKNIVKQKTSSYFTNFNNKYGFNKQGVDISDNGSFSISSSRPVGIEKHVSKRVLASGCLPNTKNLFNLSYDTDRRGKADSIHLLYDRTTLQVQIPNIKNQFLLNSKLNDAKTNVGNLSRYPFSQKIETSESIYKYVNVFIPSDEQVNFLTLLTPDVIALIMRDFIDADIEFIDDQVYFYFYGHINEKKAGQAIIDADEIIRKMKLGKFDSRESKVLTNHLVSRVSVEKIKNNRLREIPTQAIMIFVFAITLMFVFAGGPFKLLLIVPGLILLYYLYKIARQYNLKKQIKKEITAYF